MNNAHGLDARYFNDLIARALSPEVVNNQTPADLARTFARAARTACPEVLQEAEFQPTNQTSNSRPPMSLKIRTEAHGLSPTFIQSSQTPRIAFVEPTSGVTPKPTLVSNGQVLLIYATDISYESIKAVEAWPLRQVGRLSEAYKQLMLLRSSRSGFPHCPMSINDAQAILSFYRDMKAQGCDELVVSCEYGRSRSVTTAAVLSCLENESSPASHGKNQYIHDLLIRAVDLSRETKKE